MGNKIHVTVSVFFEIKDAEIYGGKGSIGYSETKIDMYTDCLDGFNLQEFAKHQGEIISGFVKVPEENTRIISRTEYEEHTEDSEWED